ncbi:hypothetical protein FRB99_006545 [Tulasnella sp. 403]|nr:hypothetical protein FRB99_006545 [Tulasnella sp. 403]
MASSIAGSIKRLPKDFLAGFATAAFQVEGSVNEGGRGPSIWDDFSRTPGKTLDGRNGDVATDSYRLWKEDIKLLKEYGIRAYRFSISWPRIIPLGGRNDPLNEEGIKFYNDFIDALLAANITPFVTLYHWDLPQALHDRYGGWLNKEEIQLDFAHYAKRSPDPVDPSAVHPLLRTGGDSKTEPYIVAHNLLISHALAVKVYREEFKPQQGGQIGITLNGDYYMPYDDSPENVASAQHALDYHISWYADPIYLGYYPEYIAQTAGDRLPKFTDEEIALVHGSSDFYGMNTYTTDLTKAGGDDEMQGNVIYTFTRPDGTDLGCQAHCGWLQAYAPGFRALLNYLWKRYKMPIYVTENGFAVKDENDLTVEQAVNDVDRINYFAGNLEALFGAIEDGVVIKSYFGWSFLDNFEWADGYGTRFGVTHVNYETQERTPKNSARFLTKWFKDHIEGYTMPPEKPDAAAVAPTKKSPRHNPSNVLREKQNTSEDLGQSFRIEKSKLQLEVFRKAEELARQEEALAQREEDIAHRELLIALKELERREQALARREERLARREKALLKREAALAQAVQKETNSVRISTLSLAKTVGDLNFIDLASSKLFEKGGETVSSTPSLSSLSPSTESSDTAFFEHQSLLPPQQTTKLDFHLGPMSQKAAVA